MPALKNRITNLSLAGCVIALAGCTGDDLSRNLGMVRDAPDEFTVTTRAPLAMPPSFSLPPPRPGTSRPQEQSERAKAEEALVPQMALTPPETGASPGQQALVQQAGPQPTQDIRSEVDQEAAKARAQSSGGFFSSLMFWRPTPQPGIVVDPSKESQRLRENSALGQSQDTGDTPIEQPKKKGLLEGLF